MIDPVDKSIRLLYVEDDTDIRVAISQILGFLGYTVAIAGNGRLGVEKAISWQPDIILMDIRMPVMGGIEATRRLRQHPDTAQIPVLMISAFTDADTRSACRQAGANGFLEKPVGINKLTATIEKHLQEMEAGH